MTGIVLRPDLRTSGGEICDILLNGRFIGNMTLVYRENDVVSGAVQLDETSISDSDKYQIFQNVRRYVLDLAAALRVSDCDVIVTCSPYHHIIEMNAEEPDVSYDLLMDEDVGDDEIDFFNVMSYSPDDEEDQSLGDEDADRMDRIEMLRSRSRVTRKRGRRGHATHSQPAMLELVIVEQSGDHVKYHVYDQRMNWLAEAQMRVRGENCSGTIEFTYMPNEDEIEAVADLIISDFDENEIDSFDIRVLFEQMVLERMELKHEELSALSDEEDLYDVRNPERYSVVLARDDGEMLTYEIYDQRQGSVAVGTATVDIAQRQLSGFIDFRERLSESEQEEIAAGLMRELDKEKEYRSINLSVMHRNEKIDEMMFENETLH